MSYVSTLKVVHALGYLLEHASALCLTYALQSASVVLHILLQRNPVDEFDNQVQLSWCLDKLVHFNNIRVI